MRRLACLLLCVAVFAPVAPAGAQSSAFGPLPQAAPTATPTPQDTGGTSVLGQDVSRATLFAIAGGFLVLFIAIGWWISRDARRTLPAGAITSDDAERRRADPKERHRREREKARARRKTRAQRAARKTTRRRARRK